MCVMIEFSIFFFFKETATTDIYAYGHTLSLHEALPISQKTAGYEGLLSMGRRFKSCRARQLSDFCRVYAMESRDPLLQDFLTNLAEAFRAQAMRPEASAAVVRISGALKTPRPAGAAVHPRRPVSRPLANAIGRA